MSLINVQNLTFAYEGSYDNIFEDASFVVDTDWRIGFCGRNGRGKTTFLRLLMRSVEKNQTAAFPQKACGADKDRSAHNAKYDYKGTISASVRFDYFPLEVADKDKMTLCIMEEVAPNAEFWRFQRELSLLKLDEDALYRSFSSLSLGEQTKVLLAGLFLRENNFLLIDEPTNHLDAESRRVVAAYLKSKKSYILVSHDRTFLDDCVDHILIINKTNIEVMRGNYSVFHEQRARRDAHDIAQNRRLESEIVRLEKAKTQTARFAERAEKSKFGQQTSGLKPDRGFIGAKAAKMMKRAKAIEKRADGCIQEKERLLKDIETAGSLKIEPLKYHAERLLTLTDIYISYGEKEVVKNFSLTIERGERVALKGANGSGKSSILKVILGESGLNTKHEETQCQAIPCIGEVSVGSKLIISYVPQDTSHLKGSLKDYARDNKLDETFFKTILHKLDFSQVQFDKDISSFSSGQKKKVLLAHSLSFPAHIYIWDEPLNYIDILSREQIEELILSCRPTMLFIEHDSTFCKKVATREIFV